MRVQDSEGREVRGCVRIAAVLCGEWGRAIFGRDGGAGQVPVNLRVSYWWQWNRDYRITVSLSVWVKVGTVQSVTFF